jgi:hypothetical protein
MMRRQLIPRLALIAALALTPLIAAAQDENLPPEVRFDILRLELDAAARAQRHKEVLVIADRMRKMGLEVPAEMPYLEARAFHALGAGTMARDALVQYLKSNGRAARHYDEAIKLFVEIKRAERKKKESAKARATLIRDIEKARTAITRERERREAWKKMAVVFGGPGDDSALSLAHGADGVLLVAGALHVRKTTEGKTVNTTLPWITAFDKKGPRAWHRPLGSAEDAGTLRSAVAIPGGGFLFGGAQKGFQFAAVSDALGNLINNEDGDPWVIGFAPATGEGAGSIARLLPSGDIIAVGTAEIGASRESGKAVARLPVMVRLSQTGKVLGKAVLGDTKILTWHRLRDAVVIDAADVILAGAARRNSESRADAYLMRIDAEGKNIWTRPIPPTGAGTVTVNAVIALPGGGVLAAGRDGTEMMVMAVESDGVVRWRKTLPTPRIYTTDAYPQLCGSDDKSTAAKTNENDLAALRAFACQKSLTWKSEADSITATGDRFIIIGHNGDATGRHSQVILSAINGEGEIAWQSTQGTGTGTRPRAAVATADDGIIIAGTTDGWGRDVALFKVDAKGELVRFGALSPRSHPPSLRPGRKPAQPSPREDGTSQGDSRDNDTEIKTARPEEGGRDLVPDSESEPKDDTDEEKTAASEDGSDSGKRDTGKANSPNAAAPSDDTAEYELGDLLNRLFKAVPNEEPKSAR